MIVRRILDVATIDIHTHIETVFSGLHALTFVALMQTLYALNSLICLLWGFTAVVHLARVTIDTEVVEAAERVAEEFAIALGVDMAPTATVAFAVAIAIAVVCTVLATWLA